MDIKKLQKLMHSSDKRRCSSCGKMLDYKNFGYVEYEPDKYKFRSPCKECENLKARSNPLRHKYRFSKYGLSKKDYLLMLAKQNNQCAICGEKPLRPIIDHCHQTNKIRGVLCNRCNSILGFAEDKIHVLEAAIVYLENRKDENLN